MFRQLAIYIVDSCGSGGVWKQSWMTAMVAISLHHIENNKLYVNICLVNNIMNNHDVYITWLVEVSTMCWSCKLQYTYICVKLWYIHIHLRYSMTSTQLFYCASETLKFPNLYPWLIHHHNYNLVYISTYNICKK